MPLDPKLAYWTWALANFAGIVACAGLGVRGIRRRDVRTHRRCMLAATALVGLFLGSYVLKVIFLGREDLGPWSAPALAVLRAHEACIFVMLVAGATAGTRAWRFCRSLPAGAPAPPSEATRRGRLAHRRAGWTAVVASGLALATAVVVLAGMYARAGGCVIAVCDRVE
jgi:uncharacterized membrane protein YozB (DUF420 family)